MRARRMGIPAWALAALLATPAAAYYHYIQYGSLSSPYQPMPAKFDLNALPNKTVTFFVSDSGPARLAANDSFASVLGNIRQAALAWNAVDSSDLRVAYGGLFTPGSQPATPIGQVIFTDDLQPGVIAQGGPTTKLAPTPGPNGSFVPITTSVVLMNRDLTAGMQPSYTESFFLTVVHEMGHALGLQHTFTSSVMSTGVTRATTRARPIDADDVAGLSVLYPKAGFSSQFGSITGRVTSNGQGVHLASVVALRPAGSAISALTNPDGTYRIDGLPPDTYWVYVHAMPPSSQPGLGPGDVQFPLDPFGRQVRDTGPIETLFFPGTRDPTQFVPISVSRGGVLSQVDFSVQRRPAVAIYDVTTYSYFGQVPAKSAYMNSTSAVGTIVASGAGLTSGVSVAPGLSAQVLGGFGSVNLRPYPFGGYTYLALDLNFPLLAGTGPRHLYFTLPNDAYVLPNGVNLTQKQPPSVNSVTALGDGTLAVSGTSLAADSRIYFDSLPATLRSFSGNDAGATAIVTPPAGFSNQVSSVTVYNSDGQNSTFLQPQPVTFAYGPADPPSFNITAPGNSLPAGASAMIDLQGVNTKFADGQTVVGLGSSDLYVRRVWVLSPTHLWANVTVSANATPGAYAANVATGFLYSEQPFGFSILPRNPLLPGITLPLVNAATGQSGIYPGATVSISGSNLNAFSGNGVTVTLSDQPVNVTLASPTQINFQVPPGMAVGPAVLKLNNGAADAFPVVIQIDAPPPVISAVLSSQNTVIDAAHPASAGDMVTVILLNLDPSTMAAPSRVHLIQGGADLVALSVAPVPGQQNVFQAQFLLSPAIAGQVVQVSVSQDGSASAPVSIAIR